MQLEEFKIAVLRVFYDIVNSDGIIDDNEILFLENLKEKYGVLYSDGTENIELVTKAHQITFVGALGQLKEWEKEHEFDENGKRLHKNVRQKPHILCFVGKCWQIASLRSSYIFGKKCCNH